MEKASNKSRNDAYVIIWQENDKDGVERDHFFIPEKHHIEEKSNHGNDIYCRTPKKVYLKDYRDVQVYIRKHLANKVSNLLIAKVVDLVSVNLISVDD